MNYSEYGKYIFKFSDLREAQSFFNYYDRDKKLMGINITNGDISLLVKPLSYDYGYEFAEMSLYEDSYLKSDEATSGFLNGLWSAKIFMYAGKIKTAMKYAAI